MLLRVKKRRRSEEFPLTSFVYPHSFIVMQNKNKKNWEGIRRRSIENWTAFTLHQSKSTLRNVEDMRSIFNHTIIFHLYCYCLSILFFSVSSFTKDWRFLELLLRHKRIRMNWYRLTRIHFCHISILKQWIKYGIKIRN